MRPRGTGFGLPRALEKPDPPALEQRYTRADIPDRERDRPMKPELVGETVTVSAPAATIAALAYETAAGLAAAAEFEFGDASDFSSALSEAAGDLNDVDTAEARIVIVADGLDVTLAPAGGSPAATVEYRA